MPGADKKWTRRSKKNLKKLAKIEEKCSKSGPRGVPGHQGGTQEASREVPGSPGLPERRKSEKKDTFPDPLDMPKPCFRIEGIAKSLF